MIALASVYVERAVEFFTFRYAFAVDALLGAMLVGAVCGFVGTFLVLRGLALIGDATGHATLPGVCVGFLLSGTKNLVWLLLGALGSGLLATALVAGLSRGPRVRSDAAIGVVLSVFFGLGIVLLSYAQNSPTAAQSGLQSFLFGSAAAISRESLWLLAATGGLVCAGLLIGFRPLAIATFDEGFARSVGIRTTRIHFGVLVAVAVAVVVSIQAVGVVLVAAMLIIPPSAALRLSRRLTRVAVISAALGALAGALGAFASYLQEGLSTGPTMVIAAGILLALSFLVGHGGPLQRLRRPATLAEAV